MCADEKASGRLKRLAWYAGAALSGAAGALVAFGILAAGETGNYLGLQAASDPVHRLAVAAVPACAAVLVLVWMLSELGRLRAWLRWSGRTLVALSLAAVVGLPVFVLLFDLHLESRGLVGQLTTFTAPAPVVGDGPDGVRGPFRERSAARPNLAVENLDGGDVLTLDRRTLARKRPSGSFAWHLPRPGPPPAALVLDGRRVFYSGPGPDHEDDVVVVAADLATGRRLWSLHCLGNAVSEVALHGSMLAFTTRRPSTSAVHLVDLDRRIPLWARRMDGSIRLPPRFGSEGVEVALDGRLVLLDLRDGRVVAWTRGEGK